jgi:hypothetical protein
MDETTRNTLQVDIFFAVLAAGAITYWLRKRWKRAASARWPMVAAEIVHSAAGEMPSRNKADAVVGVLHLDFEYVVTGTTYRGHCEEEFPNAAEAKRQLTNYLSLPFYIRYDPANPPDFSVDPYRNVRGPAS